MAAPYVWQAPVGVSGVDYYAQQQESVAGDARGDAIVAWSDVDGAVGYAYRPAGGAFQVPVTLSGVNGADNVHAAMNASGVAAVTWDGDGYGAHVAIVAPPPAAPDQFTVDNAPYPNVSTAVVGGIDDSGAVTLFWNNGGLFLYSRRPAGGTFATPRAISIPSQQANNYWASVAGNGTLALAWTDYHSVSVATGSWARGMTMTVLESNDVPSALLYNAGWAVPGTVRVATNPTGWTAVAAMTDDGSGYDSAVIASSARPGGAFSVPAVLENDLSPMSFTAPVVVGPSGHATVAWSGTHFNPAAAPPASPFTYGVFTATSTATGTFKPPVMADLATSTSGPCAVDLASDPAGTVYAVWNEYGTSGGGGSIGCDGAVGSERAAIRPAGTASFGSAVTIGGGSPAMFPPVVAAQGHSGAIAAWPQGVLAPQYQFTIAAASVIRGQSRPK